MEQSFQNSAEKGNNQRFRDLLEHIAIGLVICNTDGVFLNVNEPFCKLTGYSQAELLKFSFSDITHPDDISLDIAQVQQTIEGKIDHFTIEKRYIRKNKSIIWVNLTVSLIRDENNAPHLFFGTVEDISLRKKTEFELTQSKKDWKNIFQAINQPTALLDKNHNIVDINDAIIKFSGKTKEELIGAPCFKIFHGKDVHCPPEGCPMNMLLKTNKAETLEMEMNAFNGTFLVSCTPIFDENTQLKNIIHIATDITYLKQIEKALQESETRYRILLDTAPVGIAVHSDGKVVFVNPTGCQILEAKTPEQLIGKNISEIIDPSTLPTSINRIQRMMAGEKGLYPVEDKYICLDGSVKDVQVYATPIRYKDKPSVQAIIMDITESKKAKESLQEWERRFTNIMKSVNLVSITLDIKANITFCNQYLLDLTGYSYDEIIGRNWFKVFIPSEFNDDIQFIFNEAIKNATIEENYENEILARNGSKILISWNNTLLKGENGEIIGTASIGYNITERKLFENALKKSELLLFNMGQVAKVGGWEFDTNTMQGTWTDEVAIIHDLVPGNKTNVEIGLSFYKGESKIKIESAIKDAIELGIPYDLELELTTPKGNRKWIKTIGQVEKINNKVVRVFGSFQDITDRVLVNQELIRAKEKAEESDRLKTAFLQNMSHEIRTPLNAIMGFANLLPLSFNNSEKIKKFTTIIKQRGTDLLDIINDLLDIAKIESNQLTIHAEECKLNTILSEIETFFIEYRMRNNKELVEFKLNLHCDIIDKHIIIDSGKLKQILINLVTNAFKFTQTGFIEIGCNTLNSNNLLFYVSDTGIGIPKDKQTQIFERFMQVSTETSHLYGGTGLGLSIVKGLLNLLGGEIWVESELNKGSTFNFTFSFCLSDKESNISSKKNGQIILPKSDLIILIVEDDYYNAEYLKEIFSETNYTIIQTDSGEKAIEIANSQNIDLILMDIRLPKMNGYEATRLIKKLKPEIKIIAQTAYATPIDNQKAIEAGCDSYISKPVVKEELIQLIQLFI